MPWRRECVEDQKLLFVADCLRGEEPMTMLCERYGISRETGYVLKRRFLAEGPSGLAGVRERHCSMVGRHRRSRWCG